jgi:hypothetical protein
MSDPDEFVDQPEPNPLVEPPKEEEPNEEEGEIGENEAEEEN